MNRPRWAVAARLARREVRRHPWRHALVVALILVPVLAVLATFSLLETAVTIEQRSDDFRLSGRSGGFGESVEIADGGQVLINGPAVPVPVAQLPAGTHLEQRWQGADWLLLDRPHPTGEGPALTGVEVLEAPEGSRIADRFVVSAGRLPRSADEVLLTEAAMEAGGWRLGDVVESARGERTFEVVGTGVLGDATQQAAMAVADLPDRYWTAHIGVAESVESQSSRWIGLVPDQTTSVWLPAGVDESMIDRLGGASSGSSDAIDVRVLPGVSLAATAVCALAAIVASAAFALASRQQLRSIGLLSTVGADPAVIRAMVVLQGALPGLLAGIGAVVIGAGAQRWANSIGIAERLSEVAGAEVLFSRVGAVLAIALGTFSGILAAWQPARTASRVPVLTALAGRRPAPPLPTKVPLLGLVCWIAGSVLLVVAQRAGYWEDGLLSDLVPFLAIIGTALFAFGGLGMAPLLVVLLGRSTDRTGGMVRLAGRGLTRQRTSTAAAVAAIGVALALPVGFLTAEAEQDRYEPIAEGVVGDPSPARAAALLDSADHAVVAVGGALGSPDTIQLAADAVEILGPTTSEVRTLALADEDDRYHLVSAIDPRTAEQVLAPWAAEAIAAGEGVRFGESPASLAIDGKDPSATEIVLRSGEEARTFALRPPPDDRWWTIDGLPAGLLLSTEVLGDYGTGRPLSAQVLLRPGPLTGSDRDKLSRLDALRWDEEQSPTLAAVRAAPDRPFGGTGLGKASGWLEVWSDEGVSYGSGQARTDPIDRALIFLALGATGMAMLVLAITLSLRSYDGRDDTRAALAAGAPPAKLRSIRALEGVGISLLGAVLALPLGWAPVVAVRLGDVRTDTVAATLADRMSAPGWLVVPVLLAPALLAGLLWLVVPALSARLQAWRRGPIDILAPRW